MMFSIKLTKICIKSSGEVLCIFAGLASPWTYLKLVTQYQNATKFCKGDDDNDDDNDDELFLHLCLIFSQGHCQRFRQS